MTTAGADTAAELTSQLCAWLDRLLPDRERGGRLERALVERFGGDERAVTADLCREIEAVAHGFSRHLELEYDADGTLAIDTDPPGWPPPDPDDVRRRAGSVGEVRRRSDGIGLLALDGHDDVRFAGPYVHAAFALLRGARGVVLDLRRNRGGDLGTAMLVLEWLLGGGAGHICDVTYRDRTRQWWTSGRLGDTALPEDVPVAVLVSGRTFSSGEGLAYHLRVRGRVRVVGQRTPGAADHVTPICVSSHVRAILPEAWVRDAVTDANWEGTGVVPDVECDPDEALDAAVEALNDG